MDYFIYAILYPAIKGHNIYFVKPAFELVFIPTQFFHVFFGAHNVFSFIKLLADYPVKIRGLFMFLTEFATLLAFYNYTVICF